MAEKFNINDERSFYLAGIRDLAGKIKDTDRLQIAYEAVRTQYLRDAEERKKEQERKR